MQNSQPMARYLSVVMLGISLITWSGTATAAEDDLFKTANGLTVYLGVVPAGIIKGPGPHSAEQPMHGRAPKGPHEYHIVAAVFDTASGARVSDATVTAKVSGLGLSGSESKLEPMRIADTTTYGAFVYLPGADLYTIRLTTLRAGMTRPAVTEFKYDHRRQ